MYSRRGMSGVGEGLLEGGRLAESDEIGFLDAVLEDDEVGDVVDAVLGGEIGAFVDVDLADFEIRDLGLELLEDGNLHPAGAAPRGPEIDEDEAGGDEIGKRLVGEFGAHDTLRFR